MYSLNGEKGKPEQGKELEITLVVFDGSKKSTSKGNYTRNEVFYGGFLRRLHPEEKSYLCREPRYW
jgi:hypothetical protein